jgi:hypothetical protein
MRFSKPRYDSVKKVYESILTEGLRFTTEVEGGQAKSAPTDLLPPLTQAILANTVGWFSKPITEAWLTGKIQMILAPIPAEFDGMCTWSANRLIISKEVFLVEFALVESIPTPPVTIDFEGDEAAEVAAEVAAAEAVPPVAPPPEPTVDAPANRRLQKQRVMKARLRAARALFMAERLTQDYIEEFCGDQDTEWEDESDSEDDDVAN